MGHGRRSLLFVGIGLATGLICLLFWDDVIGPVLGVDTTSSNGDRDEAPLYLLDEQGELEVLKQRAGLRGLPGTQFASEGSGVLRGAVFRHVEGGESRPLAGVRVLILGHDGTQEFRYEPETDAEGRFEVPEIQALFGYLISVRHPPFKEKRLVGVSVLEDRVRDLGRILLGAPTTLSGEVRTVQGGPPRGAIVQVFPDRSRTDSFDLRRALFELQAAYDPLGEAAVGGDGRFSIDDLPPGRYLLRVSAPGYATAFRSGVVVTLDERSSDPRVVLDRGAGFVGRVTDEDGNGVGGARLLAAAMSPTRATRVDRVEAVSESDGAYRLDTLTPGVRYFLEVYGEGFAPYGQIVTAPGGVTPRDFGLLKSGRIEGQVTDTATGAGVAGAQVTVVAGSFARMSPVSAVTDAGGWYVLPNVSAGPVILFSAAAPGYQQADKLDMGSVEGLQVIAGETTRVDWPLEPGGRLVGTVSTKAGEPVPYATVALVDPERRWAGERTALTDTDGAYEIDGLRATRYDVRVTAPGFAPLTGDEAARVDVPASLGTVSKDIVLADGATINGVVRAPDGTLVSGAQIHVEAVEPREAGRVGGLTAISGAGGSYAIVGVPPLTNVRVVVAHDAYVKSVGGVVRFTPGERRDVPLMLRPGARIEGRVTTAAGHPVADARVRWGNVDGVAERRLRDAFRADEYLGQRVIYSGSDGSFVLDNIEPGKTLVKVERAGHAPWYRRDLSVLAEGTQPLLAVELEGALTISGRVVADRSGVPLGDAVVYCQERGPSNGVPDDPGRVQALVTVNTDVNGRFLLEGVPPGRYDVVVWFATGYVGGAQDWRHERSRRREVEAGVSGLEFRLVTERQRAEEEAEQGEAPPK